MYKAIIMLYISTFTLADIKHMHVNLVLMITLIKPA